MEKLDRNMAGSSPINENGLRIYKNDRPDYELAYFEHRQSAFEITNPTAI